MPRYPTRSYLRAHPSFQLNDGSETLSPAKRSPSKQSPYKKSSAQRPGQSETPSKRPKPKVITLPILREGSIPPTPRTTDPTTPQTYNPPPREELARAPRKLRRATNVNGGDDGSWLAVHKGVQGDVSPLTSFAPGRLSILPEAEVEDESVIQREYVNLMKSREEARKEKENRIGIDQGASSEAVRAGYPATGRGIMRADTEEVFK